MGVQCSAWRLGLIPVDPPAKRSIVGSNADSQSPSSSKKASRTQKDTSLSIPWQQIGDFGTCSFFLTSHHIASPIRRSPPHPRSPEPGLGPALSPFQHPPASSSSFLRVADAKSSFASRYPLQARHARGISPNSSCAHGYAVRARSRGSQSRRHHREDPLPLTRNTLTVVAFAPASSAAKDGRARALGQNSLLHHRLRPSQSPVLESLERAMRRCSLSACVNRWRTAPTYTVHSTICRIFLCLEELARPALLPELSALDPSRSRLGNGDRDSDFVLALRTLMSLNSDGTHLGSTGRLIPLSLFSPPVSSLVPHEPCKRYLD